jgi:uncharacterized tellurite resistance protein B-like protein
MLTEPPKNKLTKSSPSEAKALAGILFATGAVDKNLTENEKKRIKNTLARIYLFENWSKKEYEAMENELIALVEKQESESVLETSAAALSPRFYETAFALAIDLILADGVCDEQEQKFIKKLQQTLQLDEKLAVKITEVIIIKNKFNKELMEL